MSVYIACSDKKIEVDINNKVIKQSKLLTDFYDEYKGSTITIPFNSELFEMYIKNFYFYPFDSVKIELIYIFLNYLIIDDVNIIKYLSYGLYRIKYDEAQYFIENTLDLSHLKLLLEKGEDILKVLYKQKGGFIQCINKRDYIGVYMGIIFGENINEYILDGFTPLQYFVSAQYTDTRMIKLLLENGADINKPYLYAGGIILEHASTDEVVKLLEQYS